MTEIEKVKNAILGEIEAEKNRDIDADMAHSDDDFTYIAPETPIIGKQQYREQILEFFKSLVSIDRFDILKVGISASNDLAYAVGVVTWTYKGQEGVVTASCKWHRTLKKEGGEWKLLVLSWCI